MEEQKSFFEQLSPKSALTVGLVGGVMALCTIGFVILLVIFLKGGVNLSAGTPAVVVDQNLQAQVPEQPTGPVDVGVGHFPALGKDTAPVTIIEFADFRCPFCERFYSDAGKGILKDYVATGKVKFYYRNYAFLGPASDLAAEASECANEQGKFWSFYNWMFEHQASESDTAYYSADNLIKYAVGVGLNKAKFTQCLNNHKYAAQVVKDLRDGQAAGVDGTPTIFINGMPLVGAQPYATVKAAIDQVLAGK